jgi:hypothetical protein
VRKRRGFLFIESLRTGSALIFPRDFAAQKARYPRDEFFLPSLKRAPGAVSFCGFKARRRQKIHHSALVFMLGKISASPLLRLLPPVCNVL